MGFEPLVNQRLLPPSFPRYTAIFGREQVSKHFYIFFSEHIIRGMPYLYISIHVVIIEVCDVRFLLDFFSKTHFSEIRSRAVYLSGPYSKIRNAQGTNQNAPFQQGPLQP